MAINGVSNYNAMYGSPYTSKTDNSLDYKSWVNNAADETNALKDRLNLDTDSNTTEAVSGTSSTGSTNSTASTGSTNASTATSTGTSSFLLGYKNTLQNLESVSDPLRLGSRNNVFSKYENALKKLENAVTDKEKTSAQAEVDSAKKDIISAVEAFAKQYNDTVSFLQSNTGRSKTADAQLRSLQRSLSTEGALATVGLSINKSGALQVDEEKLSKALDQSLESVKETLGGQFGIAERAATRATQILDNTPIENIAGESVTGKSSSGNGRNQDLDDFTLFANFAKGGYNLKNYYAVGALLNMLA